MTLAIALRADNDNCPYARLRRALEQLELAVEKNRLACLDFKETISRLKESVHKLDDNAKAYQHSVEDIGRGVDRVSHMSKNLVDDMNQVTE